MKKKALLAATTTLLILSFSGLAAGVVGHNGSDGDMHIMNSGSSASASQGVNQNGTQWKAEVSQLNSSCWSGEDEEGISDISYAGEDSTDGKRSVSFTGKMEVPNPCHTVDHSVERQEDGSYVIDIQSESRDGTCVQCVGMLRYEASFETDQPFELEVRHDGETVNTLEYPGNDGETGDNTDNGVVAALFNWLRNLF